MSINSILIATDLSERSDRALQRGFRLAAELGAKVSVISVVDDTAPDWMVAEFEEKSRKLLEAAVSAIGTGVETEIIVKRGDPISQLIEIVNSGDCDLVVVGKHRARGLFDGLRPTTVESVVSRSLKPVLLVVEPAHGPYGRVLAPVSFSPACYQAVEKALCLAPEATFRMYHAWFAPFEGLTGGRVSNFARAVERETAAQAVSWAEKLPASLEKVVLLHESVGESLSREMRSFSPDLLAVGANTRGVSFTGLGSFTASIVRDPPTDILIARGAEMQG